MKNVFTYFVLVACIVIYAVSLSEPLTKQIFDYKFNSNSLLASDKYRYGDLFGMSYYPNIVKDSTQKITYVREKCDSFEKDINLYALCDSYIWPWLPSDTFYCRVNKLTYATVNHYEYLKGPLDTSKANVLLFGFAERNIMFMVEDRFPYMRDFLSVTDTPAAASQKSGTRNELTNYLFNKNINTNLEFNIFETSLFTGIKKMKAAITFDFLKTPHEYVSISPDKKYILNQPTIDPLRQTSSFNTISDVEIDTVVSRLNQLYDQYRSSGFTEVYLSIIPNPVSVLYPDFHDYKYNNLILRVQNHPALKMPFVDIYPEFKKNATYPLYQQMDSHWNWNGVYMWLNKFNRVLRSVEK